MFEVTNLYQRTLTTVEVTHNKQKIEFIIGSVISKRNKAELDAEKQFVLLNAYLDYKGNEFKEELFNRLVDSENEIILSVSRSEIHPLPYNIVHPILDMFDIMDVFNFIKNIYRLVPPKNLSDAFDPLIESDGRGTRVQTYLKDDYLELAALALIIKTTLGPVCHFAYVKNKDIHSLHTDYILLHFYNTHHIFKTPPMVKLLGLCEKLVNLPTVGAEADAVRILEKRLPKEDMPLYILGIVVIQKISIATLIDDNENKNIITKIYNYINNRLKPSGDVSNSIRNKTALTDPESGGVGGDRESIVESYRIMSDLTKGEVFTINER